VAKKGFDLLHLVRAFNNHQIHMAFSALTVCRHPLHYSALSLRIPNQRGPTMAHEAFVPGIILGLPNFTHSFLHLLIISENVTSLHNSFHSW
jgi:hypothetical protein